MVGELSLFVGTFTTLLAIINPFEVLPVYLKLLEGKDAGAHRWWRGNRAGAVAGLVGIDGDVVSGVFNLRIIRR